jgi:hypothetical protein
MGWVVSITPRPLFTPGERTPGTHCTGGWVGPGAGLDTEAREKILCPCRGSNPDRPVVQPVVRHYTAWANPARNIKFRGKTRWWLLCRKMRKPVLSFYEHLENDSVCRQLDLGRDLGPGRVCKLHNQTTGYLWRITVAGRSKACVIMVQLLDVGLCRRLSAWFLRWAKWLLVSEVSSNRPESLISETHKWRCLGLLYISANLEYDIMHTLCLKFVSLFYTDD